MIDDVLQDGRIDPDRVYLMGYSMGGFGAWELAARDSDRFAAVVPIAGGGDPDLGKALADIQTWAVHGLDDEVVPIEGSRKLVEAIRDAGGDPRFSELTEVIMPESEVLRWLFQQTRPGSQIEHVAVGPSER